MFFLIIRKPFLPRRLYAQTPRWYRDHEGAKKGTDKVLAPATLAILTGVGAQLQEKERENEGKRVKCSPPGNMHVYANTAIPPRSGSAGGVGQQLRRLGNFDTLRSVDREGAEERRRQEVKAHNENRNFTKTLVGGGHCLFRKRTVELPSTRRINRTDENREKSSQKTTGIPVDNGVEDGGTETKIRR